MRVLLAVGVVALSAACSTGGERPVPPVVTDVALVVDRVVGPGWRPFLVTEPEPQPLGPATLRLHDGRTVVVPEGVRTAGWCWELGRRPGGTPSPQCYLGLALAADGRTVRAATLLAGEDARGLPLSVGARDQDRFLADRLVLTGTWRRTGDGVATVEGASSASFRTEAGLPADCVEEDRADEVGDGAHVSVTVDPATAALASVTCLYTD